jgi:hypothetical protein
MHNHRMRRAVFAAVVGCAAQGAGSSRSQFLAASHPGDPVSAPCVISNLQVFATEALQPVPVERSVTTANGDKVVTIVDGHRTMYVLPPDEEMLNATTETLDASSYPAERMALTENLAFLAKTDPKIHGVARSKSGSLDIRLVSRDALDGGVIAIAELFNDARHTVTTLYFLNADPAQRHFQSVPAFVTLRDGILREFGRCGALQGP